MRRDSNNDGVIEFPSWTKSSAPATITKASGPCAGSASFDSDDDDDDATEEPDSTMDVN
jgi:hypothetical protein